MIASSIPYSVLGEPAKTAQMFGSQQTYLRRYMLISFLAVAAEDDDDGAQASDMAAAHTYQDDEPMFQPPELKPDQDGANTLSDPQRKKIYALRTKLLKAGAFTEEEWQLVMSAEFGTESVTELTKTQASSLIERLVKKEEELDE